MSGSTNKNPCEDGNILTRVFSLLHSSDPPHGPGSGPHRRISFVDPQRAREISDGMKCTRFNSRRDAPASGLQDAPASALPCVQVRFETLACV